MDTFIHSSLQKMLCEINTSTMCIRMQIVYDIAKSVHCFSKFLHGISTLFAWRCLNFEGFTPINSLNNGEIKQSLQGLKEVGISNFTGTFQKTLGIIKHYVADEEKCIVQIQEAATADEITDKYLTNYDDVEMTSIKVEVVPDISFDKNKVFEGKYLKRNRRNKHEMHKPIESNTLEIDSENVFKCRKCKMLFPSSGQLSSHIKLRRHKGIKLYQCGLCKKSFSQSENLHQHIKMFHKKNYNDLYRCNVCIKSFPRKIDWMKHQKIHAKDNEQKNAHTENDQPPAQCDKQFPFKSRLVNHRKVNAGEKLFICSTCKRSFSSKATLHNHSLIHVGIKNYQCFQCGKLFMQPDGLTQHMKTHYKTKVVREKRYKCDMCEKAYFLKASLQDHKIVHHSAPHSAPKPHQCQHCGKIYTLRKTLAQHEKTHTGGFNHLKCEICGKTFLRKLHLENHSRKHTGEKPFRCSICEKCFAHQVGLKAHEKLHSDNPREFQCTVCGKTFTTKGNLDVHMRTHTGEKPYHCDTCGKSFSTSSQVTLHNRVHTGIKPFACPLCTRPFARRGELKRHMHIHSGVNTKPNYQCEHCGESFHRKSDYTEHGRDCKGLAHIIPGMYVAKPIPLPSYLLNTM